MTCHAYGEDDDDDDDDQKSEGSQSSHTYNIQGGKEKSTTNLEIQEHQITD